jgi:uncharacterized protein (DUF885 family)
MTYRSLFAALILAACSGGSAPVQEPQPKPQPQPEPQPEPTPTPQPPAADPTAEFARFVDDFFAAQWAFSPSDATGTGFHEYDDKIEDRSRARIEARIAELKALLGRLQKIDRSKLAFDDAIDAEALDGQIRGTLLDMDVLKLWKTNPMAYSYIGGGAIDVIMKREFAPAPDRVRSVIARLKGIPALYDAARANVDNPPREFTDIAILMVKGSIGFYQGTVPNWAREVVDKNGQLVAEVDKACDEVSKATIAFAEWLEKDLLPRSRGAYAIGAEHFLAKLEYDDMVDLPLEALLARGEAQLARDRALFLETAKKIDAKKTPAQVMKKISDDRPTAKDLIPSVARSVEEARQYVVAKDLITIPSDVRPKIQETPVYQRGTGFASMDTPGAYEKVATEAFYYVTPVEKDWDKKHADEHLRLFNRWVTALINVHEAYPGHYVQFLYAPKFPTKTRKLIGSGTNAEGWAHYTEQMMIDEGFGGGNPKMRLAQLYEALLRDCRYVVGIKLHTQGMTVDEGTKVFVDQCFQEPANAYMEARRGTFNPTYLYYTLGKLEIMQLRDDYRKATGATLKQFHDAFVAQGALPIPLVRKILMRK